MLHNIEHNCSINFLKDFFDGEVDQTLLTSYSGNYKIFNTLSVNIHFNFSNQLIALTTAVHTRFGSLNETAGHNFLT